MTAGKFRLETTCVDNKIAPVEFEELFDKSLAVTYRTFRKHCDIDLVAASLGYAVGNQRGLHMSSDWAVSFYRSRFRGQICYYMDWSAIEHIFTRPNHDIHGGVGD